MKYYVKERGLEGQYYIDSAGISGYHSGDPADRRMQSHAIRRGYDLTSLSRKFYPDADFSDFDMIIGMVICKEWQLLRKKRIKYSR